MVRKRKAHMQDTQLATFYINSIEIRRITLVFRKHEQRTVHERIKILNKIIFRYSLLNLTIHAEIFVIDLNENALHCLKIWSFSTCRVRPYEMKMFKIFLIDIWSCQFATLKPNFKFLTILLRVIAKMKVGLNLKHRVCM